MSDESTLLSIIISCSSGGNVGHRVLKWTEGTVCQEKMWEWSKMWQRNETLWIIWLCFFFHLDFIYIPHCWCVCVWVCVWFGLTLRPAAHHRPLGSKTVASKPLSPLWSVCVCLACVCTPSILTSWCCIKSSSRHKMWQRILLRRYSYVGMPSGTANHLWKWKGASVSGITLKKNTQKKTMNNQHIFPSSVMKVVYVCSSG